MFSLEKFPHLPNRGEVNVCEVDGKIQALAYDNVSNYEIFTNAVTQHPKVCIPQETGTTALSRPDVSRVFVSSGDSLLKQIVSTWYEEGLISALSAMSRDSTGNSPFVFRRCAQILLTVIDAVAKVTNKFHPHLRDKEGLLASVSRCRDWNLSAVRSLDWHPNTIKLAVAVSNDSVHVYSVDSPLVPVLKCHKQIAVSCLAWRPFSAAELAVGCQNGVFLWTVDPSSVVARPSVSCAVHLERPGHGPITSVTWAPWGDLLVTASAADSTMYVWDPAQQRSAPLRRLGGGAVCLVTWDPTGKRLFAATAGQIFRVWSTIVWTPERWSTPCGRVQTACWSPLGSVLLFCTTTEPVVYCLRFDSASAFEKDSVRAATPLIDLTPVEISKDGERVGGLVTCMVWDTKARHLALVFRDTNVVAVFRTCLGINFTVAPCCFVNGLPGEVPSTAAFQKNFDEGSLLTIAWSSGRLQHFPIICSDLDASSASGSRARHLSASCFNNTSFSNIL